MTDNTVYEVIDRVDTPAGGPTSSFYEKTAATETTGASTPNDTAYTVVDRLDTQAGSPTSSFYEKGSVYSDLVLSDSLLVQTQAARDAAVAAQAAAEASASGVLVETNARIAADALKANIASPTFTGVPTAPTAAALTNTTQLATTAFATAADAVVTAAYQAADALKAPLASPALTGVPVAPTATLGTNTTQLATTAFTQAAIAALVASSPAALDTLNELAAALGNDASFSTTVTNALALKAPLASPALSGVPTAPTAAPATNTTQVATTAFVEAARVILAAADALKAPLASPALTGTPTAPTPSVGDNSTKIATTAFFAANDWRHGECKFSYVSSSQVILLPFNGSKLIINGAVQTVPSAGVTASNASLSVGLVYYAYAWMNAGTMTLEMSTTGHSRDTTTGVEIKTGDATRTLVGMVRTGSSSLFWDQPDLRWTRSWFNDTGAQGLGTSSTTVSTTNLSWTALDANASTAILMWAGEQYSTTISAMCTNNTAGAATYTSCYINSVVVGSYAFIHAAASNYYQSATAFHSSIAASDSVITFSLAGQVGANTGTWSNKLVNAATLRK